MTIAIADQEWLDAVNLERKKEQLNQVTYETFEIIMDRLEKEWFDLVCAFQVLFYLLRVLIVNPTVD
jgi:hypothetical protein